MAVITRQTLVLRGVPVLRDGVVVEARRGAGYQGLEQPPTLFSMRHPSPMNPRHAIDPDAQPLPDAGRRQARAARWAGRPGFAAGGPPCWSRARRATGSLAWRALPGSSPHATATTRLQATGGSSEPRRMRGGKRGPACKPWFTGAGVTSTTPTRGAEA